jgi:hypothetical protein
VVKLLMGSCVNPGKELLGEMSKKKTTYIRSEMVGLFCGTCESKCYVYQLPFSSSENSHLKKCKKKTTYIKPIKPKVVERFIRPDVSGSYVADLFYYLCNRVLYMTIFKYHRIVICLLPT